MPLVVDAYNVLQTVGVLPKELAHIELAGLIGLLTNSRYRHDHTWLVCDGGPRKAGLQRPTGHITVQYSGPEQEADDVIEHRIAAAPAPKQLMVVSSDRRLRKAARTRRCRIVDSPRFLETLLRDYGQQSARARTTTSHNRPHRLTAQQVQQWIIEFDLPNSPWLSIPATSSKRLSPTSSESTDALRPPDTPAAADASRTAASTARSGNALASTGISHDMLAEAQAMVAAFEALAGRTTPEATRSDPLPSDPPLKPASGQRRPTQRPAREPSDNAKPQQPGKEPMDDATMRSLFPGVEPLDDH